MSAQPTRQRRNFQEFTKMATPATEAQAAAVVGDSVIDLGAASAELADDEAITPAVPAMMQDAANNVTRSGLAPAGTAKATLEIPKATALPAGFDDPPSSVMAIQSAARPYATTMVSTPTPASPMVGAVATPMIMPVAVVAPAAYLAPAIQVSKVQPATRTTSNKKFVVLALGLLAVGGGVVAMMRGSAAPAPVTATAAIVAPVTSVPQKAAPIVAQVAPVVEAPVAAVARKAAGKGMAAAPVAAAPEATKAAVAVAAVPVVVGDLAGAINRAAGPVKSAGDVTAETGEDRANVPQRPSQGAMTGALRPNIAAASKCLGDGDGDSRATIVFESTGKAQSVSVSGPAAGTSAEACITKALMKTKIGPFADATYSTPVTIRH